MEDLDMIEDRKLVALPRKPAVSQVIPLFLIPDFSHTEPITIIIFHSIHFRLTKRVRLAHIFNRF
jgi:hypothetical protein